MFAPDIKSMFVELNDKHFGGEIPSIPVVWNTRMTTTAGYCRYRRTRSDWSGSLTAYQIDLSDKLFRNEGYDHAKIERTLIHEMVHAFLIHKYNEKGHTARFQQIMTKITGEYKNHRCHNYNTEGLKRKNKKNIQGTCGKCGYTFYRARSPMRGRQYTHKRCGGVITFTKVSLEENNEEQKINIF